MKDKVSTNQFNVSVIANAAECIISPRTSINITDISKQQIKQWLATHGVVILRNFNVTDELFSLLVGNNSNRVILDPARKTTSKNTQTVNGGNQAIGLHCENGNAPCLPDILWFHCVQAAEKGSQTTFCDGEKVWCNLSQSLKNLFVSKKIKYSRNVPAPLWKKYVFHELGGFNTIEEVTFHDLLKLSDKRVQCKFILEQDESVFMEIVVPAVHSSMFSSNLTFANSLLGPSEYYQKPTLCFDDDTQITAKILAQIKETSDHLTKEINWQTGDIAIIDNTRYMHGRRMIEDPARIINAALAYL